MAPPTKNIQQLLSSVERIENLLLSPSPSLPDIQRLEYKDEKWKEGDTHPELSDISWNIRAEPSTATVSDTHEMIDLHKIIFHHPIILQLSSRWEDRVYRVSIPHDTISTFIILPAIKKFYAQYEDTKAVEEDEDEIDVHEGKYYMGVCVSLHRDRLY